MSNEEKIFGFNKKKSVRQNEANSVLGTVMELEQAPQRSVECAKIYRYVVASGFAPEDLSKKLAEKLESVEKKAIVTVTVTGITNNKVYVFGGGVEKTIQGATYSGVYF